MFTSSESIMRNNPTNPNGDPFDSLSRVEKLSDGEPTVQFSELSPVAKTIPNTPSTPPKAIPDSPTLPASLPVYAVAARQSTLSYVIPALSISDRQPGSADPEGHLSVPPHPPLLLRQPSDPF